MNIDDLLRLIACPACLHKLEYHDGGFLCPHCEVVYPIRDDIPILLIEEAIPLTAWKKEE